MSILKSENMRKRGSIGSTWRDYKWTMASIGCFDELNCFPGPGTERTPSGLHGRVLVCHCTGCFSAFASSHSIFHCACLYLHWHQGAFVSGNKERTVKVEGNECRSQHSHWHKGRVAGGEVPESSPASCKQCARPPLKGSTTI